MDLRSVGELGLEKLTPQGEAWLEAGLESVTWQGHQQADKGWQAWYLEKRHLPGPGLPGNSWPPCLPLLGPATISGASPAHRTCHLSCALSSIWPYLARSHMDTPGLLGSCLPSLASTRSALRACSPYHRHFSGLRGKPLCFPASVLRASAPTLSPSLHPRCQPALTPGPRAGSLLHLSWCLLHKLPNSTVRSRLSPLPIFVEVTSVPLPGQCWLWC